eukprot:1768207-Amphidinium_carterae.1
MAQGACHGDLNTINSTQAMSIARMAADYADDSIDFSHKTLALTTNFVPRHLPVSVCHTARGGLSIQAAGFASSSQTASSKAPVLEDVQCCISVYRLLLKQKLLQTSLKTNRL